MSKPGKRNWKVVKWIPRYLKDTIGHGIMFSNQQGDYLIVGYVDSDYIGDMDDKTSITRCIYSSKRVSLLEIYTLTRCGHV